MDIRLLSGILAEEPANTLDKLNVMRQVSVPGSKVLHALVH